MVQEPRLRWVCGGQGCEGFRRTELGARCYGAQWLGPEGGPEVKRIATEDGKIALGGLVRPLEAEIGRVCLRLWRVNDAGEGFGEALFGEAQEGGVDVRLRERR
jgi:hypothetical protein